MVSKAEYATYIKDIDEQVKVHSATKKKAKKNVAKIKELLEAKLLYQMKLHE